MSEEVQHEELKAGVDTDVERCNCLTEGEGKRGERCNVPWSSLLLTAYRHVHTRPDIANVEGTLPQYCESPCKTYWSMKKRLFRYLNGTQESEVFYKRASNPEIVGSFLGYADADWAGVTCQKSTNGSVPFYEGCLILWKSRKQSLVAISTKEAEMIAVVDLYREHKAVHNLFV